MNRYQPTRPMHRFIAAAFALVVTVTVAISIDSLARSYGEPMLAAAPAATRAA